MNKNGFSIAVLTLFGFLLTSFNATHCTAQLYRLDENIAQGDDKETRGGYITEFLSQRSGESGIFGFIGWLLSKEVWRDAARYVEKKIQQKMEALLDEFEQRNADSKAELSFHALDVFSQPLVFV